MIGSLGDIVFEVSDKKLLTANGITRSVGSNWTTHQLIGGKVKTEYSGAKLQSLSMTIQLNSRFGVRPRKMLDKLAEMAEGRKVYPLIIGGKPVGRNYWRITSVSESWGNIYSGGELASASVQLTLEEYI